MNRKKPVVEAENLGLFTRSRNRCRSAQRCRPCHLPRWDLQGVLSAERPEKIVGLFRPAACSKPGKSLSETPPRSAFGQGIRCRNHLIELENVRYPPGRSVDGGISEPPRGNVPLAHALLGGVRPDRDPLLPTVLPFVGDSPTECRRPDRYNSPHPGPSSDSAILEKIWYNHIE